MLAFSFYVHFFKSSFFLTFSKYKYTLAHFQQKTKSANAKCTLNCSFKAEMQSINPYIFLISYEKIRKRNARATECKSRIEVNSRKVQAYLLASVPKYKKWFRQPKGLYTVSISSTSVMLTNCLFLKQNAQQSLSSYT